MAAGGLLGTIDLATGDRGIRRNDCGLARSVSVDAGGNRLLVLAERTVAFPHQLCAIDLSSGDERAIWDWVLRDSPTSLWVEADSVNNRALVGIVHFLQSTLFSINLDNGVASVISDIATGSGPELMPYRLALDGAHNRALVLGGANGPLAAVIGVDLTQGNRTVFSSPNTGSGPAPFAFNDLVVDSANNRALATERYYRAVFSVDLSTGDRTILSQ